MTDLPGGHPGGLSPAKGSTKRGRYLGRGRASGHGKTSGRGFKGQFSRTGAKRRPGFRGGDLPLVLKIPKRGFLNPFKIDYQVVNVSDLEAAFSAGATVDPAALVKAGVLSTRKPAVKVLGDGAITKALTVSAHAFTESAKKKIAAAGGSTTTLS
jgi:large subunit ribosomal protein L15